MACSAEIKNTLEKICEELRKNPIPTKVIVVNPSEMREPASIMMGGCCDGIYPEREFKAVIK